MTLGLNRKLNIVSVSTILLVVSVLTFHFVRHDSDAHNSELNERAMIALKSLSTSVELPILAGDRESIARMGRSMLNVKDVVYCKVVGLNGDVLFEEQRPGGGIRKLTATVKTRRSEELEGMILGPNGLAREEIGWVELGVSTDGVVEETRCTRHTALGVALVTILLLSATTSLLFRYILIQPITALVMGTQRIGAGELDYKVSVHGEDEIGVLAVSFNSMTEALSRQANELAASNLRLQEANEELKELDRMKSEFISNVSHELRTPLTAIRAYAETMSAYDSIDVAQRGSFLAIIIEQVDRLTHIVEDLLDISRIEAGALKLNIRPVDFEDAVETALISVAPIAEKKDIEIRVDLAAEKKLVATDEHRLIQILINVLSNAVKFTDRGGLIRVSSVAAIDATGTEYSGGAGDLGEGSLQPAPQKHSHLHIAVQDNGVGIAHEELSKIFDRFRQIASKATGKPNGTGLGLTICKDLIERMGGRIWVESSLGQGSTFHFTLPLVKNTISAGLISESGSHAAAVAPAGADLVEMVSRKF